MSARTRKARKLRRIGWQRGAARLRRSSDLDRARGALRGAIAALWDLLAERNSEVIRAEAYRALDYSGRSAGGGGGAPVIPDHMPATANPTPCGS